METVAGIFQSREQAEKAIQQIHSAGIRNDRIALLTPDTNMETAERAIPTADSEQPGMGKAMGGTVGGAMGVAGGASLGAAAASVATSGLLALSPVEERLLFSLPQLPLRLLILEGQVLRFEKLIGIGR